MLTITNSISCIEKETKINSNVVDFNVNDNKFTSPILAINQKQYEKAFDNGMTLQGNFYQQFIHQAGPRSVSILDTKKIKLVKKLFNDTVKQFHPKLRGITFYYDSRPISQNERKKIWDIQNDLDVTFFSDIELDKNQEMPEFQNQIGEFKDFKTDKIKCPTISLRTTDIKLLIEKFNYLVKEGFECFNLEWGGVSSNYQKLNMISKKLANKKIICNVVSMLDKFPSRGLRRSNAMIAFAHGVSSVGFGTKLPSGSFNNYVEEVGNLFNNQTFCYEKKSMSRNIAEVESHNLIHNALSESVDFIKSGKYYTNFIPKQFGLNDLINKYANLV